MEVFRTILGGVSLVLGIYIAVNTLYLLYIYWLDPHNMCFYASRLEKAVKSYNQGKISIEELNSIDSYGYVNFGLSYSIKKDSDKSIKAKAYINPSLYSDMLTPPMKRFK